MRKEGNVVFEKSKAFAVRIIRFKQWLCAETKEYSLADQVLRSGTSIGANISEAVQAASRKDFINKLNIALKECSETEFWLSIMYDADIISREIYDSLHNDCIELYKLLLSIIKTTRNN
ncbi:MAG: four helix bundle protein [Duncaniella sp.]|nr:four helix bundle protein [Duncaniella sp.]MDE5733801.1 four helix bundle protein [Duncaniella sp.]MDE6178909.1 four helix bundle protein [Duncaniella sp.]